MEGRAIKIFRTAGSWRGGEGGRGGRAERPTGEVDGEGRVAGPRH